LYDEGGRMNRKAKILIVGVMLGQSMTSSSEAISRSGTVNIYEKMQSFSCDISKSSKTLHLIWSDDTPYRKVPSYRPPANAIRVVTEIPRERFDRRRNHIVEVRNNDGLEILVDSRHLKVDRLWVSEPSNLPFPKPGSKTRPLNHQEIDSIKSGISKYLIECMNKPYYYLGLNDEFPIR
jgi:hypothetical protein